MAKPNHSTRIEQLEAEFGDMKAQLSKIIANQAEIKVDQAHMKQDHTRTHEMLEELLRLQTNRRGDASPVTARRNEGNPVCTTRISAPRFDFPRFTPDNPRSWLRKCNKYFMINLLVIWIE